MGEKNPLEFSTVCKGVSSQSNRRGRPTMAKIIKFSPQPKSMIIAKIVNKMKTEESNVNRCELADFAESTQESTEHDCSHRANELKKHKRSSKHRKNLQYSCDYLNCTYTCKLSCNLVKHKRIHTAEKPYLCDQCTFRSNFVNSLKVHKRTHTAERPYGCKDCSYRCNSSSNLKKHCLHRHPEVCKT